MLGTPSSHLSSSLPFSPVGRTMEQLSSSCFVFLFFFFFFSFFFFFFSYSSPYILSQLPGENLFSYSTPYILSQLPGENLLEHVFFCFFFFSSSSFSSSFLLDKLIAMGLLLRERDRWRERESRELLEQRRTICCCKILFCRGKLERDERSRIKTSSFVTRVGEFI